MMPSRFLRRQFIGRTSGDLLLLESHSPDSTTVLYQPSRDKLRASSKYANPQGSAKANKKLLHIDAKQDQLTIYPLNTLPRHEEFLEPKYHQIISITLEGFGIDVPESADDIEGVLEALPSGFVKDYGFGLGLLKDYRFIVDAIEAFLSVKHLVISKRRPTQLLADTYVLSYEDFDAIRRGINRITRKRQEEGSVDKYVLVHNSVLTRLDPKAYPERSRPYKKDTIFKLISGDSSNTIELSDADQDAALQLVDQNKREIARKSPKDLQRLRNDIDLVSLEVLISKYEEMLSKNLPESRWQALFNENPFILNLAFGYPVVKIQDQAHVGGRTLSGSGETIADFLVKNRLTNNSALFEIKNPGTPLLNKTPYREELYTPSSALSGAMNQMLDQKNEFQKDIARIKESSQIYNLESYSVHGVLVIGVTPADRNQQKSFELFRGNSKDITIITFDELLGKLKSLHEFLSLHAPEARQASVLHGLETRLLKLQRGFHNLYEYSESKSGSLRMGTSKLLPGVDGRAVMSAIGRLALLKMGFENARLEKPPYPVAFDESGENTIKVETVDEFITRAEEAIANADSVLALQPRQKED
jgi:hypothetical protein